MKRHDLGPGRLYPRGGGKFNRKKVHPREGGPQPLGYNDGSSLMERCSKDFGGRGCFERLAITLTWRSGSLGGRASRWNLTRRA